LHPGTSVSSIDLAEETRRTLAESIVEALAAHPYPAYFTIYGADRAAVPVDASMWSRLVAYYAPRVALDRLEDLPISPSLSHPWTCSQGSDTEGY
jgi:hypothetical protein